MNCKCDAVAERYWLCKTEDVGGKPIPGPFRPPQNPKRLACSRILHLITLKIGYYCPRFGGNTEQRGIKSQNSSLFQLILDITYAVLRALELSSLLFYTKNCH